MARYKSCFTLKNILLIVFAIMIMKRIILKEVLKEVLKEGHTDNDGNLKDKHGDDNHEDNIYYLFGAQSPAPRDSITNRGFKYLTKIKGVKKGTQVVSDNIGGLDNKDDTARENSETE